MRVAVLSDIHSNIVALDAVLSDAGDVDAIWHLGDVVGYGPQPDAVVARGSRVDPRHNVRDDPRVAQRPPGATCRG